ncbi:MAG: LysM peptidoglycan-binding domain-containing protein [Bacilli bacterium]|nr:LysM peptidoglycan-binding domain-containing protein [Bacilli bacterium]
MNQTYIVKAGDTLWGISNQFGVSVTELARLNDVYGSVLPVGKVLKIPSSSGTNPNNMFLYTVKKGDSLYSIARVYETSVDAIMDINHLTSVDLKVGQVIRIPEMFFKSEEMVLPSYINYQVKKGDSLYSIARQFGIPVETIIADNGLGSNTLKVGQNLKIRTALEEVEECFGEAYVPRDENSVFYTVKKGDSLYSIAMKFNSSVEQLKKENSLTSNTLSIGQILQIPSTSSTQTYTVQRGDSLYRIARKFNSSVEEIKKKNNLKSNLLSVGQVLKI